MTTPAQPEKSLGQIAAEAAGYQDWKALPASVRAEWQRGAEAIAIHVQKQCMEIAREAGARALRETIESVPFLIP